VFGFVLPFYVLLRALAEDEVKIMKPSSDGSSKTLRPRWRVAGGGPSERWYALDCRAPFVSAPHAAILPLFNSNPLRYSRAKISYEYMNPMGAFLHFPDHRWRFSLLRSSDDVFPKSLILFNLGLTYMYRCASLVYKNSRGR